MEESDILLTFTQVTVAFVGFAGIIATFQFRDDYNIKKKDAVSLELIINTGLMGAFFSVLPLILSSFGLSDASVWSLSSGIMSVNYLGFMYYLFRQVKRLNFRRSTSIIVITYFVLGFLVIILNLMNVFNIVFQSEFGPFFISLTYPLALVGFMFSRLLLSPIWRMIRNRFQLDDKS